MAFSLTGDKAAIAGISVGVQSFFKNILPIPTQSFAFPDFATTSHPWYTKGNKRMSDEITAEAQYEAFLAATRLNSVAKGGLLFDPGEPVRGHDLVVLEYIGGYFLYKELRFGQGASDAMAVLDIDTGSVVYQSNQAPDIGAALDIYDQGVNFVVKELGGKSSLPPEAEGAIIGAIAKLDGTAIQPSQVGYVALIQYLKRDSKAGRQKFRDEILGSTVSQLLTMADRLGSWGKPSVAVITNQALYDEAVAAGLTLSTCRITGLVC
jgi:Zn-dependent M16 (insulinase) family peptidase